MAKFKKIKILAFAKFQAILILPVGLVAGVLYSFGGLIIDVLTIGLNLGTALAFLAIIGMPIVFATFGFFVGIIEAVLFNLFSKKFGGIEMDFLEKNKNEIFQK